MRFHIDQNYINTINKELSVAPKGSDLEKLKGMQRLYQPLYDTLTVTNNGEYTFFKGSNGRTRRETNFAGANVLDAPRHFLACGVSLHAAAGVSGADLAKVVNGGLLKIQMSETVMLEIPLVALCNIPETVTDPGEATGIVSSGRTFSEDGFYALPDPILIAPGKNISPTVEVLGLPGAVNVPLTFVLTGFLFRK